MWKVVGEPIFHERLSHLVATILEETLRREGAPRLPEEKEVTVVDRPLVVAAMTYSSIGDTSRHRLDKRPINDTLILPIPATHRPDNRLLGEESVRPSTTRAATSQIPFF